MAKADAIAQYPHFPWLEADAPAALERFLQSRRWLAEGERVQAVGKAGQGNMNLTLKVRTDQRVFVIKQARPWVEKYDTIDAPWERALVEQRFYQRAASLEKVALMMPRLLNADPEARVLMLEYVEGAGDFADLYQSRPSGRGEGQAGGRDSGSGGRGLKAGDVDRLAGYLAALHEGTAGDPDPDLANRAMRQLNAEHIFRVPLATDNGLDLDAIEPGLADAAAALRGDDDYLAAVARARALYLAQGPCLLHGDFFPGSWLRGRRGPVVIDPEFCFFGDRSFDLAVPVAHLLLAGRPLEEAKRLVTRYVEAGAAAPDPGHLARFTAIEIMRRLIGVAQLPLDPPGTPAGSGSDGFRTDLLARARPAAIQGSLEPFE